MIPQIGQHIKCFFRNGAVIEGIVESWDITATLRSFNDQSLLIIPHPKEDIMLIKILPLKEIVKTADIEPLPVEGPQVIKNKLQEVREIIEPELKNKSIKELQRLIIDQEKKIVEKKIKQHYSGSSGSKTNYSSQIDFLRKK
jgi:hypothetical protein